jgi:dTDP-4-amino-4,6-dideoxygalactose transaminase
MRIRFHNIYKSLSNKNEIEKKIISLILSNIFIGGKQVEDFEKQFAKFTQSKYCVSVGNGTDALEIALESLNIKRGYEVILPVNTWISTAEIVIRNGLKVVFCDINLNDYSINFEDLKNKISKKTKLIIPVHLYGNPADMIKITKISKKRNIKIIEDCAQAHGATINKKQVGTFGEFGTFSFYPGKNLGAFGDGGCIVTNNKRYAELCQRIRNHGALKKYDHTIIGRNSRLDTIQSAILSLRLPHYRKALKKRNLIAKLYEKKLKEITELKIPSTNKGNYHAYHQYVIRTNRRNELREYLTQEKIDTMIHYPYMLSELKIFKTASGIKNLKNSINLGKKILSLPISEEHGIHEINFVIKKIKKFFSKNRT